MLKNVNLVRGAFPLKNGWGGPPIFLGKSPGDEVVKMCYVKRLRETPLSIKAIRRRETNEIQYKTRD